jgi:SNF2 family DNA or RNA helicase
MIRRGLKGGLFLDMRLGKTYISLYLAKYFSVRKILVILPLYAAKVWRDELAELWPSAQFVDCTKGSVAQRAERLRAHFSDPGVTLIAVGYESYWRSALRNAILEWQPELVIADEGHRLANRRSQQSRFAHVLGARAPYRLMLSGTPLPGGIPGIYSEFLFIDRTVFGTRWSDFESAFIIKGGYGGYEIKGFRNTDIIEQRLHEATFRCTRREVDDQLPPEEPPNVILLDLKDRKSYNEFNRQAVLDIDGIDASGAQRSATVLSRIVLTKMLRLQQLTSGFVRDVDGSIVYTSREKLDALQEMLEDLYAGGGEARKIVIFCRFTPDVDRVAELSAKFAETIVLDGRSRKDRDARLSRFQQAHAPIILVGQIATTSEAIDLSCAEAAIFYSLDASLVHYEQAKSRLYQYGDTHTRPIYHLVIENSVDQDLYETLRDKLDVAKSLLDAARRRMNVQPPVCTKE